MTDTYTIYLVNHSASAQNFWCFLAPPEELSNNPNVYANSSASLAVDPNYAGTNEFIIPVQYVVGAGGSNQAVGLDVKVVSNVTNNASLTDTWNATYANAPPNKGPQMSLAGSKGKPTDIAIVTNGFDKIANERAHWYSNQTFGIESAAGFIGMTWSPEPAQTRVLTPKLTFYVAVGSYGSNVLANYGQFSNSSAEIHASSSFDQLNECTVTYTSTGGWEVAKGRPATLAISDNLAYFRSPLFQELAAIAQLESGNVATDTLVSVAWDSALQEAEPNPSTILTGTITVATALGAAFAYFFLSGLRFEIKGSTDGRTTFEFSYNGPESADAVKNLFVAGAKLTFGGPKKAPSLSRPNGAAVPDR